MIRKFKRTAFIWNRNGLKHCKCLHCHFWSIECVLAGIIELIEYWPQTFEKLCNHVHFNCVFGDDDTSAMTYRCVRQENRRDLMTKQAVVVRRKMDTPIAVVATLGMELTMFSFCSEWPSVKKTHKPFKDVRHRAWRTNQGQAFGISGWARFTSFDSDSMTQTFSEGLHASQKKVILVSFVTFC